MVGKVFSDDFLRCEAGVENETLLPRETRDATGVLGRNLRLEFLGVEGANTGLTKLTLRDRSFLSDPLLMVTLDISKREVSATAEEISSAFRDFKKNDKYFFLNAYMYNGKKQ